MLGLGVGRELVGREGVDHVAIEETLLIRIRHFDVLVHVAQDATRSRLLVHADLEVNMADHVESAQMLKARKVRDGVTADLEGVRRVEHREGFLADLLRDACDTQEFVDGVMLLLLVVIMECHLIGSVVAKMRQYRSIAGQGEGIDPLP